MTVEVYDPATNSWARKENMPTPRWGLSTSVVNDKIYAIGGTPNGFESLRTVEIYDPVTNSWAQGEDMPTPRWGLSTSVVNDKIYAVGGTPNGRDGLRNVEVYDPVIDAWAKLPDMPTLRGNLSTSAVNGKVYAIGGSQGLLRRALSTVEAYDTGFLPQSVQSMGKLTTTWSALKYH